MRCTHSAVDYLIAAADGEDSGRSGTGVQGQAAVEVRVEGGVLLALMDLGGVLELLVSSSGWSLWRV